MKGKIPEDLLLTQLNNEVNLFKEGIKKNLNNELELHLATYRFTSTITAFSYLGAPLNFTIGTKENQPTFFSFLLENLENTLFIRDSLQTLLKSNRMHIHHPDTLDWEKFVKIEQEADQPKGSIRKYFDELIVQYPKAIRHGDQYLTKYRKSIIKERGLAPEAKKSELSVDSLIYSCISYIKYSINSRIHNPISLLHEIDDHLEPIDQAKAERIEAAYSKFS